MSLGSLSSSPRTTWLTIASGWILVSLFVGEMRLLQWVPLPAIPAILGLLTATLLAAYWCFPSLRQGTNALPLRALVGLHAIRFAGFYFIVLQERSELPGIFSVMGWGEIVVAGGAVLITMLPQSSLSVRRIAVVWNLFAGLALLAVVGITARVMTNHASSLQSLTELPLSFLPLVVVPLLSAAHVILMVRLLPGFDQRTVATDE